MPYKYVLKWYRGEDERVVVEAWTRYPTSDQEKKRPEFTIGEVNGSQVILIRDRVERAVETYGHKRYDKMLRVTFPLDDVNAIAEAYRIGLAAAVLTHAGGKPEMIKASSYVLGITDEEVWFWTSKLLDRRIGSKRAISSLCIMSGTWDVPDKGKQIKNRFLPKDQNQLPLS